MYSNFQELGSILNLNTSKLMKIKLNKLVNTLGKYWHIYYLIMKLKKLELFKNSLDLIFKKFIF